jgi:DNA-binding transcriptional LysR family regulator
MPHCSSRNAGFREEPMEFHDLEVFRVLAEELHFGRAARRLHMDVSSLSRHLRGLEEEIGAQLVLRDSHRVRLTAAGRLFASEILPIIERVNEVERLVKSLAEVDELRIGHTSLLRAESVLSVLVWLRETWPLALVRLHVASPSQLVSELASEDLDLILVHEHVSRTGIGLQEVAKIPLVVAVPRDHPFAQSGDLDLARVLSIPIVIPQERNDGGLRSVLERLSRTSGRGLHAAAVADDPRSQLTLAVAGYGPTIVPAYYADDPVARGLIFRQFAAPSLEVPVIAAWRLADTPAQVTVLERELTSLLAGGSARSR